MKVPLLDLKAQYQSIRDQVRAAVDAVFESQQFILGPQGKALEEEVARFCGVPHAVGVASGTDSLLLVLKALGVGPGDSVITVPFTFFATAGVIANLGARPLFADIDPNSYNLDPGCLSALLEHDCIFDPKERRMRHKQSHTIVKAVLPVHLYGQCADMDEILNIAGSFGLPVVEDACQAISARYRDKAAGSMGIAGCFSFFPSKNLGGAGDGGMVTTFDKGLADNVRLLRLHGMNPKYYHARVGFNSRLDEIQAAVLRVKLPHLEQWSQQRAENARRYEDAFKAAGLIPRVKPPEILPNRNHIFHQYVIRCEQRDALRAHLTDREIGTDIYYPVPLHEQECFRNLGYGPGEFPRAHKAAQEVLALPVYPEMTPDQIQYVVDSIADYFE